MSKEESKLENQLVKFTQAMTSVALNPKDIAVKSVSTLIQGAIKRDLLGGFLQAWQLAVKQGRVSTEYTDTPKGKATLNIVMQSLESDSVDAERFKVVQNIFMNAASDNNTSEALILRLMEIANTLSRSEIMILRAIWQFTQEKEHKGGTDGSYWRNYVAKNSGLAHLELVLGDIKKLVDKQLVENEVHSQMGIQNLTGTGKDLCALMTNIDTK